jgi:hypothetical protein
MGEAMSYLVAAAGLWGFWHAVAWMERWSKAGELAAINREYEEYVHQAAFEEELNRTRSERADAKANRPSAPLHPSRLGWPVALNGNRWTL